MNERASVVCVWRGCRRQLLALVPYGHWCVCAADAAGVVGRHCHMCPIEASQAIRVSDSTRLRRQVVGPSRYRMRCSGAPDW